MTIKKLTLFLIISLSAFTSAMSETTEYCRVVVYRNNSGVDDGSTYKILSNNTLITELKNKNYYSFYVPKGMLNLKAYYMISAEINLAVVKSSTCYVRLDLNTEGSKQIARLVAVDSIRATNEMITCRIPDARKPVKENLIPLNKIAMNLGAGWAFKRIPVIVTNYNDDATIGFGGGFNGSLFYTRELNEYFGMDFNLSAQESNIIPSLNNASVSFSRTSFSVQPFLIIPLNYESRRRLKLGIGLDYYLSASLDFDTEKMNNGFKESWTYDNPWGYSISTSFEEIFRNNWACEVGLKLSGVKYRFVSSDGRWAPTDSELGSPGGLSLYFQVGLGYHF